MIKPPKYFYEEFSKLLSNISQPIIFQICIIENGDYIVYINPYVKSDKNYIKTFFNNMKDVKQPDIDIVIWIIELFKYGSNDTFKKNDIIMKYNKQKFIYEFHIYGKTTFKLPYNYYKDDEDIKKVEKIK